MKKFRFRVVTKICQKKWFLHKIKLWHDLSKKWFKSILTLSLLSHKHSLTLSLFLSFSLSLFLSFSLSLFLSFFLSLSHTSTHTISRSFSHFYTQAHSFSLSLFLSLSHTNTHTYTLSHTLFCTFTFSHFHTIVPSLPPLCLSSLLDSQLFFSSSISCFLSLCFLRVFLFILCSSLCLFSYIFFPSSVSLSYLFLFMFLLILSPLFLSYFILYLSLSYSPSLSLFLSYSFSFPLFISFFSFPLPVLISLSLCTHDLYFSISTTYFMSHNGFRDLFWHLKTLNQTRIKKWKRIRKKGFFSLFFHQNLF